MSKNKLKIVSYVLLTYNIAGTNTRQLNNKFHKLITLEIGILLILSGLLKNSIIKFSNFLLSPQCNNLNFIQVLNNND